MAGLRIDIVGTPIGDRKLDYTLSVEPEDLTAGEVALVLRTLAEQLDPVRTARAGAAVDEMVELGLLPGCSVDRVGRCGHCSMCEVRALAEEVVARQA